MGKDNCTYLLLGFVLNSSRTHCYTWSSQAAQKKKKKLWNIYKRSILSKNKQDKQNASNSSNAPSRQLHFLTQEVSDRKLRFGVGSGDSCDSAFPAGCRGGSEAGSHKGCRYKAYSLRVTALLGRSHSRTQSESQPESVISRTLV